MDPYFLVRPLTRTPLPQSLCYLAMHQDMSLDCVAEQELKLTESECGKSVVKHLLEGHKGHYGPLEHPAISFSTGYFPHSVMQQARTHRINISFDVQSFRYTSQQIIDVVQGKRDFESVFYLRPPGKYFDRQGHKYEYTQEMRDEDKEACLITAEHYTKNVLERGYAPEHARGGIAFDIRQHFVVSFNLRSLMHFLDLRAKKDAQLEIQQLCELLLPHFKEWTPEIYEWYEANLLHKARLAP